MRRLAALIGAPAQLLPTYRRSLDAGRPHVEADRAGFAYVVVERGEELQRRTTAYLDELLYWIFSDVTFSMAADWELAHRVAGEDA